MPTDKDPVHPVRRHPAMAEAAITVADEAQQKALGRLLLLRLLAAARERGIQRFCFEVLSSNAGMATLISELAHERTVKTAAGELSIEIELPEVRAFAGHARGAISSPCSR